MSCDPSPFCFTSMDASTSRTPLLRSESQSPTDADHSRRRQVYLISYGGSDHNPYAPPLYAHTRFGSFHTVFLFSLFLLLLLSSLLTIQAAFDAEQISFSVCRSPRLIRVIAQLLVSLTVKCYAIGSHLRRQYCGV